MPGSISIGKQDTYKNIGHMSHSYWLETEELFSMELFKDCIVTPLEGPFDVTFETLQDNLDV